MTVAQMHTDHESSADLAPETSAMTLFRSAPQELSLQQDLQLGEVFVKSGFFQDVKSITQAAVKIMAGRELGFGPFASMRGVYIFNGRTAVEANLMAQGIKRGGKYDYRVVELTEQGCTIDFYQRGEHIGTSIFSREDAKKAGTKNMDKYPRNMLFARALSNGQRWYCPDAFDAPVYTPDELGLEQRADGTFVEPTHPEQTITPPRRKSESRPEPIVAEVVEEPAAPDASKPYRIQSITTGISPQTIGLVTASGETFLADSRLTISAKSAQQSGADVILGFAEQNGAWFVTEIEEMS